MKQTVFKVLFALSFSHLLNDAMQALIPAIYPILKESYHLTLAQCGCITLTFQVIASLLQPLVGHFSDLKPRPLSLAAGMASTFVGLLVLSQAASYGVVLIAAGLVGLGSSVFHPEASRVAKMASGGRPGLAQSVFQVGGNAGSALGPILAALVVVKYGQGSVAWFCLAALAGIVILMRVGSWQRRHLVSIEGMLQSRTIYGHPDLSRATVVRSILILLALIFSKYFYLVSISNYYTFYLIAKFHMDIRSALYCLFAFMGAVAAGTIIGGPVGDRFGRKYVIWASILGVAPFTLILPHSRRLSRPSSSMRRNCCRGGWDWWRAFSSASPSGWAGSAPPSLALSPTARASPTSTRSAPTCRSSGCSPLSCRTSRSRAGKLGSYPCAHARIIDQQRGVRAAGATAGQLGDPGQ
jgi:MFS transporter, FSR family, fosmidomycin resistance protein